MAEVKLTAARLDVFKAVARGEVKHYRNWGKDPDEDCWSPTGYGRGKRVTASIEFLRSQKLIEQGPAEHASMYAPKPWKLTEAGQQWLADNGGNT